MKNKEIMKKKSLWGLLVVLFVAVFAFAACSDDDDDDKTGTYEYVVSYSAFEGSVDNMNTVSTAFQQAFGTNANSFKLTGTKSECNRKAKEYAMKAQSALANDGSFSATIELINATTDEKIHSFTIKMDKNELYSGNNKQPPFKCVSSRQGITVYDIQGKHVTITNNDAKKTVFDDVISTNEQFIDLTSGQKNWKGNYEFRMEDKTGDNLHCVFTFYFDGSQKVMVINYV